MTPLTYRYRLGRARAGTKLHVMMDHSDNGGKTWRTGSSPACGSSWFPVVTVVTGEGSPAWLPAHDAIVSAAMDKGIAPESLCRKCGYSVAGALRKPENGGLSPREDAPEDRRSHNAYQATLVRIESLSGDWREAENAAASTKAHLIAAVVKAVEEGGVSEYTAAHVAGVSRKTLRAWLGK